MKSQSVFCRHIFTSLVLLVYSIGLIGCGPRPAPPPSEAKKSEVAQKSIETFIASAKKQPKMAAQELSVLMESLDAYASEYKGPYIELRDSAKELLSLYENSASKDKIKAQLEVLKQKADAL